MNGITTDDATFAFVDLSGFTALTEMCGDEEAAHLAGRLVDLTQDALTPHVDLVKSMGDTVMLHAPSPDQMMATIVALADRAAAEDGFLVLRVGIHHGSAVRRNDDFFGHAVNTAARVTALAGAGQAVVTEPVVHACENLGLTAYALGITALRNITSPMAMYRASLPAPRYPVDPVCRARIDPRTTSHHLRHENQDIWFCSGRCAERFSKNPTNYTTDAAT
ncbi:adenylate/guanylate cyclase domain-containing protein [Mycolicibacterium arseniciresistens]|uniref:Adenylate/guanylate cyclase domain-containing protein n=1 Tax=Mycolicibacterium arseniciresistens TaxID=3062257 RepID=A0ABT8UC00_9MYCO|nr:adenylate/guanylate cyclase domain-containing protein [Mycolicibacterium arseniciresistens]MDO3635313.1 adenylate/guanylate cyclase domain-containing protein [Mycolicibacterium arseniciresistens]